MRLRLFRKKRNARHRPADVPHLCASPSSVRGAGEPPWRSSSPKIPITSRSGPTVEKDARRMRATRENPAFLPGIPIPPGSVAVTSDLPEAVEGAEMIVAAVPSQFLRSVLAGSERAPLGDATDRQRREGDRERDADDDVGDDLTMFFPASPANTSPRCPVRATPKRSAGRSRRRWWRRRPDMETARLVQTAFMMPYFRVYASNDIRGVEIGGALKNVIAIAAGIIDGAELGDNTKAARHDARHRRDRPRRCRDGCARPDVLAVSPASAT